MKKVVLLIVSLIVIQSVKAQDNTQSIGSKKWGVEFFALWPIFPGNLYRAQVTYEAWRKNDLAGDIYFGIHWHPTKFREDEGDFGNMALAFGYRQFIWKGLHADIYQAFGPGWNRNNVIDGKDYNSWDYEVGLLAGYRWEFLSEQKQKSLKISPYLSTQHGFYYLAAQSNPHPIRNSTGEKPIYVGTLNIGIKF